MSQGWVCPQNEVPSTSRRCVSELPNLGSRQDGRLEHACVRQPRLWAVPSGHCLRYRGLQSSRLFSSALSTCPLQSSWMDLMFDQCITETVRHLDEAPFLHFVHSAGGIQFTRHSLRKAFDPLKEVWRGISDHWLFSRPDMMILVHKVPDEQQPNTCWKLAQEGQSDVTNIPAIFDIRNAFGISSMHENVIAGKVGDCCDDDGHHDHDDEVGKIPSSDPPKKLDQQKDVAFWGLVVQSHLPAHMNGCYLLKTVRNIDPLGCTCTHFSLNRIGNSTPLCDQLLASWLV